MNSNVKVGVRVRPPLQREVASGKFTNCVAVDKSIVEEKSRCIYVSLDDKPVVLNGDGSVPNGVAKYVFDSCFDLESSQLEVYNDLVRPAVLAVLGGINATVFAYGQTGTGMSNFWCVENENDLVVYTRLVKGQGSPYPWDGGAPPTSIKFLDSP